MSKTDLQIQDQNRKTGVRNAPKFSANPFMQGSSTEIRGKKKFYNVTARSDVITDGETGEITGGIEHKIVKLVDDAQFVKIFADGIGGIYDLNGPGRKVFRYMLNVVQENPNTDRIYLHFMDAMEEPYLINPPVFFRGMAELIHKHFVAASDRQNMFYLNPMMIWNGNRFRFVQEYIKDTKPQAKALPSAPKVPRVKKQTTQQQLEAVGQQRLTK